MKECSWMFYAGVDVMFLLFFYLTILKLWSSQKILCLTFSFSSISSIILQKLLSLSNLCKLLQLFFFIFLTLQVLLIISICTKAFLLLHWLQSQQVIDSNTNLSPLLTSILNFHQLKVKGRRGSFSNFDNFFGANWAYLPSRGSIKKSGKQANKLSVKKYN